jgi:DeoR family transcriptional regulator, suf operon transcriptional repressor
MTTSQQPTTKHDILIILLKQGQATAQEMADRLTVTTQAIRRHLKDLEQDGLILHQAVPAATGRPNYLYELSPEGRRQFPDRYNDFSMSLLDTLAQTVGKEQMSSILRQQWQQKAQEYHDRVGSGDLADRIANLVALRQSEGYMAECHLVDVERPESGFVLTEYNCAISQIAESYPSVCGHELEMFTIALPDCKVERTHWLVRGEHRCGYLIKRQ